MRTAMEGERAKLPFLCLCTMPRDSAACHLQFKGSMAAWQEGEWQLVTLALLRGLAEARVPALLDAFEGREALGALGTHLGALGASTDELWALMEAVLPAD